MINQSPTPDFFTALVICVVMKQNLIKANDGSATSRKYNFFGD